MPLGLFLQARRQRARERAGKLGGLGADAALDRLEARAQRLPVVAGGELVDGAQASGERRHRPTELTELGLEHGVDGLAAIGGRSPRTFGAKGLQLGLDRTQEIAGGPAVGSHVLAQRTQRGLHLDEAIEQRVLRGGGQVPGASFGLAGRRGGNESFAARLVAPALEALRIDRGAHQQVRRGRAWAAAEQGPEQVVHGGRQMPRQRRVGGAAQRVRQGSRSAWAVGAIGRTGRRVGGNRHRRLPAQCIGADAEIGQHLGGGGNVRQGVQEVVEPHVRGAVEMRHIVGAVAACQHQLVDRDRIGLGRRPPPRLAETALSGTALALARRASGPPTANSDHRLCTAWSRSPRSAGAVESKRRANPGAVCHSVVAGIGKLLPGRQ